MNWDAENRRARMRKWYADNHLNLLNLEEPPQGNDEWDLWAQRQVRRSVRRVSEAASERALNSDASEGQILARLERAEDEISQGDETAARDSLSAAHSNITRRLQRRQRQARREHAWPQRCGPNTESLRRALHRPLGSRS